MCNFMPQAFDYEKHNAVLQDLVRYNWPVIYETHDKAMLTYYIGQYLLPATIGKIFCSLRIADICMGLMGIAGMILIYLNLLTITNANKIWQQIVVFLFIFFFSGMLYPLQLLLGYMFPEQMLYPGTDISSVGHLWGLIIGNYQMEYRSFFTAWQFVSQQMIVPWLCILLFWQYRTDYKYLAMLIIPAYITSAWVFTGLVFIVAGWVIAELIRSKGKCAKEIFSLENILCAIIPGVVISLYYLGNVTGDKPESMTIRFDFSSQHLIYYALFCIFMFLIYVFLIEKKYRKDTLFYVVVIELLLIPLVSHPDFVMCTSLAALFFLSIYIIHFLFDKNKEYKYRKIVLVLCLCIGARNPVIQFRKAAIHIPYDRFYEISLEENTERDNPEIGNAMKYNYYTYNPDNTLFYKYLARK